MTDTTTDTTEGIDINKIKEQLAAHGFFADLWHIDDVKEVRPDLTDDQCRQVMLDHIKNHDANLGINWETIRIWARELFPEPDELPEPDEE
jgi:hypothetical protein